MGGSTKHGKRSLRKAHRRFKSCGGACTTSCWSRRALTQVALRAQQTPWGSLGIQEPEASVRSRARPSPGSPRRLGWRGRRGKGHSQPLSPTSQDKRQEAKRRQQAKAASDLLKRKSKSGPCGSCPRMDCCAPLKLIPPMPGDKPLLGCPRFRTGLCDGYVRNVHADEEHLLPKKMFRVQKLT